MVYYCIDTANLVKQRCSRVAQTLVPHPQEVTQRLSERDSNEVGIPQRHVGQFQ